MFWAKIAHFQAKMIKNTQYAAGQIRNLEADTPNFLSFIQSYGLNAGIDVCFSRFMKI